MKPPGRALSLAVFLGFSSHWSSGIDLTTWYPRTEGSATLLGAAYGHGRFVAVGMNGTIMSSKDGARWSLHASGTTNDLRNVEFGQDVFVAVGPADACVISSNGVDWLRPHQPPSGDFLDLAYGAGHFVATTGYNLWRSTNGQHWTLASHGLDAFMFCVAYTGDMFGNEWQVSGAYYFCGVNYCQTELKVFGENGGWTQAAGGVLPRRLLKTGSGLVGVGDRSGTLTYPDPYTHETISIPIHAGLGLSTGFGQAIVAGRNGSIAGVDSGFTNDLYAVACSPDSAIAVGGAGLILQTELPLRLDGIRPHPAGGYSIDVLVQPGTYFYLESAATSRSTNWMTELSGINFFDIVTTLNVPVRDASAQRYYRVRIH